MAYRNAIFRFWGVFVVLLAAQVAVLPSATAYEQTRTEIGVRLRLTSLPARVRLDTPVPGLSDGGRAALLRAIASWNGRLSSSPIFVLTEEDEDVAVEIVAVLDGWQYGSVIAAHTTVDSDKYQGDIRHVVIEIDGRRKWSGKFEVSPEELDLESVLLHELGHALGLDHSRNEDAIMRAGIKPGQTRRVLHDDDLAGVGDVLNYSLPPKAGTVGHLFESARKSTALLATLFIILTGLLVVGMTSAKRTLRWFFARKDCRRSLCRIGNPFS